MENTTDFSVTRGQFGERMTENNESILTKDTIKMLMAWVYRHTNFHVKEKVEDIVGYCLELAWKDWDHTRGVPFVKFIFRKNGNSFLYFQKAIDRLLRERAEKKWYIEVPTRWLDSNCKEHSIEECTNPSDYAEPSLMGSVDSYQLSVDADDFSNWLVAEINKYSEYLLSSAELEKNLILKALCTRGLRLKDVAEQRGLSHMNLTAKVKKTIDELAQRTGIPADRIGKGLVVIKNVKSLNSRIRIFADLEDVQWEKKT